MRLAVADRSGTSASRDVGLPRCSWRRSGWRTRRPRCARLPPPDRCSRRGRAAVNAGWWGDTWLVARREIDERSRAKSFWITTAIMILAVVAAVVIPAIVSHNHKTEKVGVLGAGDPALTRVAIEAGGVTGSRVQVLPVASLDAARSELRSGTLTAVIVVSQVHVRLRKMGRSGLAWIVVGGVFGCDGDGLAGLQD